ncbi:MAG: FHA domain-containing protein [Planctomycetota bacterium]
MGMPSAQNPAIVLDLLDTTTGQPLQTWRFTGQTRILIGRASESDVVVASGYVSRAHAYVQNVDGVWQAVSISTQQLLVNERKVALVELFDGCVFRLGSNGCSMRFSRNIQETTAPDSGQTLSIDPNTHPFLQLDRNQLTREVDEIANGDFFKSLSENLQRLRRPRKPGADSD